MHFLEKDSKLTSTSPPHVSRRMIHMPRLAQLFFCCFSLLLILPISFFATNGTASAAAAQPHVKKPSAIQPHVNKPFNVGGIVYPDWQFLGCGTGWNDAIDINLESFKYAYTTGSQACSRAVWDIHGISQSRSCLVYAYIPTTFATANISYGFYRSNGSLIERDAVNQNDVYGEVQLGGYKTGIYDVLIQSNNGQNGTYMAAAFLNYDCL